MSSKVSVFLLLTVAINAASAAIDFTPTVKEYSAQGFTYRQVRFKSDHGTVTLAPPAGWMISGSADRLQLRPPNNNIVEGMIQARSVQAPPLFDEVAVKALHERIINETPAGSQFVQFVKSHENPIRIDQNPSFEFVISYQALGRKFQRSVIIVNGPDTQLIFRFTAPQGDFDTFYPEFLRSVSTWHGINEPDATAPAPVASK